jgi:hypothetical protein
VFDDLDDTHRPRHRGRALRVASAGIAATFSVSAADRFDFAAHLEKAIRIGVVGDESLQRRYGVDYPVFDADVRIVITVRPTKFVTVERGMTSKEAAALAQQLRRVAT